MGDTDFPAVMGNTPVGFLQQYVKGSKMYSQKGDNVPEFTNRMGYSQQLGGPLVAHGSHFLVLKLMVYQDIQTLDLTILWSIKDQ